MLQNLYRTDKCTEKYKKYKKYNKEYNKFNKRSDERARESEKEIVKNRTIRIFQEMLAHVGKDG